MENDKENTSDRNTDGNPRESNSINKDERYHPIININISNNQETTSNNKNIGNNQTSNINGPNEVKEKEAPPNNKNGRNNESEEKKKTKIFLTYIIVAIVLCIISIVLKKYKLAIVFAFLSFLISILAFFWDFFKKQKIDTNLNIIQLIVTSMAFAFSISSSNIPIVNPPVTPTLETKEPTLETTETPLVTIVYTPTYTATSTLTLTPTFTATPSITPTPINFAIKVCVFDLGLDENNEPIVKTNVDNLQRLGFNVKIINIDEKSSYEGCEVFYLSDGWISLRPLLIDQTYLNQVMDKMLEYGGPGLLIGNPGKTYGTYTLKFYDDITFSSLSNEEIAKMGSSKIYVDRESDLYYALLKDIGDSDEDKEMLPEPESKVVPNLNATKSYYTLIINENYHYSALVSSGITGPRYLIMPGGEFSSTDPIPDYLYERFIKWLARIPIN